MIGKTLAHYEVISMLGKGGMGEVFRARDTKLGREVALKILPHELSGDPERAARFQREARSLAMLQHPNVASIYGFEEVDGVRFLVMELVDGEDLGRRIAQGPVRVEDARRIAKQMAAGLEAAHETGLVHRDLKPANVMLTADGEAKILDFGLARAWFGDATDSGNIEASPTITAAMTQAGTILGTAAYMSPEQARGRSVDRRADIWAFGVILWEMLTGEKLFDGETISDTLAAVLRAEPDWSLLPVDEAPDLCQLIERCLVRDPRQRLRDIGEARLLLDGGSSSSRISMPRASFDADLEGPSEKGGRLGLTVALAVIALLLGLGVGWKLLPGEKSTELPVLHTMLPPAEGTNFNLGGAAPGPARISPNGKMVVFSATGEDGITQLYLRHLDRDGAVAMPGTSDAAYPFWSPDSENIGFFTVGEGKLKKIAASGGPPVTLCAASNGKGGTWANGTIVFAPSHLSPLLRVADIGGEPDTLTVVDGHDSHRHPRFLPDGKHFLYLARTSASSDIHDIFVGSLEGGEPRKLLQSECQAEFSQGHLMFAKERVLLARVFDPDTLEFTGGGFPIVENIMISSSGSASGAFSVSDAGMMTYQTGASGGDRSLEWIDPLNGQRTRLSTMGGLFRPSVSPRGTHAIVEVQEETSAGLDLWLVDLETGLRTRFTFEDGDELKPIWSPDGSDVYYLAARDQSFALMKQSVESTGGAEIIFSLDEKGFVPTSVHPDGDRILLSMEGPEGGFNLATLLLDGSSEPQFYERRGVTDEAGGVYSPDGRWVAYHSSSASRWDTFIRPADGSARKWQVTTAGTVWPTWSPDGQFLYTNVFNGGVDRYPISAGSGSLVIGKGEFVTTVNPPTANGADFGIDPSTGRLLSVSESLSDGSGISLVHLVTDWVRGLGG